MSILKDIDFSTGDLSQFDSVTDTGGALSVIAAAAAQGSAYGMAVAQDGLVAPRQGNVIVSPAAAGKWRFLFWFSNNDIAGADLGGTQRLGLNTWQAFELELAIEGGPGAPGATDEFELYVALTTGTVARAPMARGWHWVEVECDIDNDVLKVWLDVTSDNTPTITVTDGAVNAYTNCLVGSANGKNYLDGPSYYIDSFKVSDDDSPLVSLPYPYGRHNLVDHINMRFGPSLVAAGDAVAFGVNGIAGPFSVQGLFDAAGATNEIAVDGTIDGVTWHEIATLVPGATDPAGIIVVDAGPWVSLRPRLVVLDAAASSCAFTGLAQV